MSRWPGSNAYLKYLERQVQELWCGAPEAIFTVLGYSCPPELSDCLQFLTAVAKAFKTSEKNGVSISEIWDSVLVQYDVDPDSVQIGRAVRHAGEQAVFAAVGLLSMLYRPIKTQDHAFHLHVEEKQTGLKPRHTSDVAKRPIAGFLRGLGSLLPSPDLTAAGDGGGSWDLKASNDRRSERIHTSTVNYYALKQIGKINIQWVDTLSAHLQFHAFSRTLLVFRYPTFCALNCHGEESDHCFDRRVPCLPMIRHKTDCKIYSILQEYYNHQASGKTPLILAAYKREVLLSYRLIFGQHRRSRALFMSAQLERASGEDGSHDHLLARLCGEKVGALRSLPTELWPPSCLNVEGHLLEQDVYSCDVHFPLLGDRLLNLQEFSLRQSPSRIRDLWRDRRNPLQWYTLWAVLIIGGVSLILQVIQVFLSAAQLASQLQQTQLQSRS